jgi:zinc/manganese transport system ATP-binding protein
VSAAIGVRDLTLGYEGHPAVHHLTGTFEAGSLTAVVGPNGSGKSTLLKGLIGMVKPLGGAIDHGDRSPRAIAYLPQSAEIDRTFPASVADLALLGLWRKRGLLGAVTREDRAAVESSLQAVGLGGFMARPLDTLSGGQLQRALFARVILQDAPVILLDEPFAAIDEPTVADLLAIVRGWHDAGRTVIAVLHDIELVRRSFPNALLLAREPIAWGPANEVLTADNLRRAQQMPEAWDEHAPWHENGATHDRDHGAHA